MKSEVRSLKYELNTLYWDTVLNPYPIEIGSSEMDLFNRCSIKNGATTKVLHSSIEKC